MLALYDAFQNGLVGGENGLQFLNQQGANVGFAMASIRLEDILTFAKIASKYILRSHDDDVLLANPFRITHPAQISSFLH